MKWRGGETDSTPLPPQSFIKVGVFGRGFIYCCIYICTYFSLSLYMLSCLCRRVVLSKYVGSFFWMPRFNNNK